MTRALLDQLGLHADALVDLTIDADRLVVRARRRPVHALDRLLAETDPGPRDDAWLDDAPVAREVI